MSQLYRYRSGDIVVYEHKNRRIVAELLEVHIPSPNWGGPPGINWWTLKILEDNGWCNPGDCGSDCIDHRWKLKTKRFPRLGVGDPVENKRIYLDEEFGI